MRLYNGKISIYSVTVVFMIFLSINIIYAQESYENYRSERSRYSGSNGSEIKYSSKRHYVKKDKPLSEIKPGDREELLDELRGAVRDEIDSSINKERKASKKVINKNKLVTDVRKIVREEIKDAIKIKERVYLQPGTFEVGGFVSGQLKGLKSDESDNNYRIKLLPMLNYFVVSNVALGLKGEADFNLTTSTQIYNAGIGPQFVYGLDDNDEFCFYTSIFAGASYNSALSNSWGFRYGNELGLKIVMRSGVIMNFGVMIAFDNAGDQKTGFQNIILPTIGISAWF